MHAFQQTIEVAVVVVLDAGDAVKAVGQKVVEQRVRFVGEGRVFHEHKHALPLQRDVQPIVQLAQHRHPGAVALQRGHVGFAVVEGVEGGEAAFLPTCQRSGGKRVRRLFVHQVAQGHPARNAGGIAVPGDKHAGPVGLALHAVPFREGAALAQLNHGDGRAVQIDAHGTADIIGTGPCQEHGSRAFGGIHPGVQRQGGAFVLDQSQRAAQHSRQRQRQHAQRYARPTAALHNGDDAALHTVAPAVERRTQGGTGARLPPDDAQDGFGIEAALLLIRASGNMAVAGSLLIEAQGAAHGPDHGIVPVQGIGQHQPGLDQQVAAFEMRQLVPEDQRQLFGGQFLIRQQNHGMQKSHQHGAGHRGAQAQADPAADVHLRQAALQRLGVALRLAGHLPAAHGAHKAQVAQRRQRQHRRHARQPDPRQYGEPVHGDDGACRSALLPLHGRHRPICRGRSGRILHICMLSVGAGPDGLLSGLRGGRRLHSRWRLHGIRRLAFGGQRDCGCRTACDRT